MSALPINYTRYILTRICNAAQITNQFKKLKKKKKLTHNSFHIVRHPVILILFSLFFFLYFNRSVLNYKFRDLTCIINVFVKRRSEHWHNNERRKNTFALWICRWIFDSYRSTIRNYNVPLQSTWNSCRYVPACENCVDISRSTFAMQYTRLNNNSALRDRVWDLRDELKKNSIPIVPGDSAQMNG